MIAPEPSLHGGHWPHDSIDRKRENCAADADHARGVVVHDEPRCSHAAPDRGEPLVGDRHVELIGGDDRVGHAREHGLHPPLPADPAPHGIDDRSQRCAELDLTDVGADDIADHRGDDVPGDASVPIERNHSASPGEDVRGVGEGLDVVHEGRIGPRHRAAVPLVGLPAELRGGGEEAVQVRGQPSGQRIVALDDLEHRLLLTEEVLVGSRDHGDLALPADPGSLELLDRPRHRVDLPVEAPLQADERLEGTDGERRDDQALDELIGVGPQQRPVLERPGLSFRSVADEVAPFASLFGDARPLLTGREPASPATAEPRPADLLDGRRRTQLLSSSDAHPADIGRQVGVQRGDRLGREQVGRHVSRGSARSARGCRAWPSAPTRG